MADDRQAPRSQQGNASSPRSAQTSWARSATQPAEQQAHPGSRTPSLRNHAVLPTDAPPGEHTQAGKCQVPPTWLGSKRSPTCCCTVPVPCSVLEQGHLAGSTGSSPGREPLTSLLLEDSWWGTPPRCPQHGIHVHPAFCDGQSWSNDHKGPRAFTC